MSPVDTRDVTQGYVNPCHRPAEQEEQRSASSHLAADSSSHSERQSAASQRPPPCANPLSKLQSNPQSAWRQSLDQDQAMLCSCDSGSSETSTTKKRRTVLVWDLDETLILFHSLLSGVYASHHSPEVGQALCLFSCCSSSFKHIVSCLSLHVEGTLRLFLNCSLSVLQFFATHILSSLSSLQVVGYKTHALFRHLFCSCTIRAAT